MQIISVLLIVLGVIGMIVGGVGMLIAGFRESAIWGLGMLIVPIVSLIFIVTHWQDAKKPFLTQVVGWGLFLLGLLASPHDSGGL